MARLALLDVSRAAVHHELTAAMETTARSQPELLVLSQGTRPPRMAMVALLKKYPTVETPTKSE